MDFKRLHYFVVVAEEQNVIRAARRLRVAQPALSRHLHALEQQVGTQLLERHARGVRLTAAGEAFLEHARRALAAAQDAVGAARATAHGACSGVLRISPPDWPQGARIVLTAVERLRSATPSVDVEYDGTPWVLHAGALADDVIDIGFGIAFDAADYGPAIAAERLVDEPAASAVLPEHHSLASRSSLVLADLRGLPLLVPAREIASLLHDQMVATVRRGGYEPIVKVCSPSFALAAQMIAAGAGWTIATHAVVEEPPPGVVGIPISDASFILGLYVLRRASDERPPVREFLVQLRSTVLQHGHRPESEP